MIEAVKVTFKKKIRTKVYRSALGGYYVLTEDKFTQQELQEAYTAQQAREEGK